MLWTPPTAAVLVYELIGVKSTKPVVGSIMSALADGEPTEFPTCARVISRHGSQLRAEADPPKTFGAKVTLKLKLTSCADREG